MQCVLACIYYFLAIQNDGKAQSNLGVDNFLVDGFAVHLEGNNYKPVFASSRPTVELNEPHAKVSNSSIVIPVVVHILYNNPIQNLPDSQVFSQIQVLNEDFGRTNTDTINTPSPFLPLAANTGIQFCLAQRDPNGMPTSGIERRQTNVSQFNTDFQTKFYSGGGLDQWDPLRYFNIWVCNTGGASTGEFPTSTVSNTYGALVHYQFFGSNYTTYGTFPALLPPIDRGRTAVHEVGHCLNLYHIWGDDGTGCTGSDFCPDTPNQAGYTSGCYSFPHTDGCTTSGNGIMFMNYMDYSVDSCKNLFTQDQSSRMNTVLNSPPYNSLVISDACQTLALYNNDAGIKSIAIPVGNVCPTFAPVVTLINWGTNGLTSCVINYRVDSGPFLVYNWSGNLNSLDSININLPPISTAPGVHAFTALTTLPNGNPDAQPSNDQRNIGFNVLGSGIPLPYYEGFEQPTFLPPGWILNNPDNYNTWTRTLSASSSGSASAKVDNITYQYSNGQNDEMTTPAFDLSTAANPGISFDYAYTYYFQTTPTVAIYSDTLTVLISTDCGMNYSTLFKKGGTQLATVAPIPNGPEFIPQSSEWQTVVIPLSPFQTGNNAILKFRNTTGWGNQLYIDNINITNNVGIPENVKDAQVNIYPNPAVDIIHVAFSGSEGKVLVRLFDVTGKVVFECRQSKFLDQDLTITLPNLFDGLYYLELKSDAVFTFQKVLISNQ
jgi:hypothetical protein